MLIVLGVRVAVTVLGVLTDSCQRCGHSGAHEVTERVRKLSVFFVPILSLGPATYSDTCTVCGWVTELSRSQAQAATAPRPTSGPQDAPAGPQDAPTWPPPPRDS